MNTYAKLDAFLGHRDTRKMPGKRGTRVERRPSGAVAVFYWRTPVVTAYPDGTFQLANGGYCTSTTRSRIRAYSPAKLVQRKFAWYVGDLPFFDGIRVDANGEVA